MATAVPNRALLNKVFGGDPVMIAFTEQQAQQVQDTAEVASAAGTQAETQRTSPVLTFAPSSVFENERVLTPGTGLAADDDGIKITFRVNDTVPKIVGGRTVRFIVTGDTTLILPESGEVMVKAEAGASLPADATDLATAITLVNAIKARLIAAGIVAP